MKPRRFSAWTVGLAGLVILLGWSVARAVPTRQPPDHPVCHRLAKLLTVTPPPEQAIFDTAAALPTAMVLPTVAWLMDTIKDTVAALKETRATARLESNSKATLATLDDAIHIIDDILLPQISTYQAQLADLIAAGESDRSGSSPGGGGGGGELGEAVTTVLTSVIATVLTSSGVAGSATAVANANSSATSSGTSSAPPPGGDSTTKMDPGGQSGGQPPEASPFI